MRAEGGPGNKCIIILDKVQSVCSHIQSCDKVCTALSQRCDKVVTGTCMMTSDKIKVTTCGSNCLERGRAKIPLSKELRFYG